MKMKVSAVMLSNSSNAKEGDKVIRTRKFAETPVGDSLLGRVVNALGEPIDDNGKIEANEYREIEKIVTRIMKRESVKEPLETDILSIDSMISIGKGQRELIIGDKQTGKTAIAIDTKISPLQYIVSYSGVTMAEYWCEKEKMFW